MVSIQHKTAVEFAVEPVIFAREAGSWLEGASWRHLDSYGWQL